MEALDSFPKPVLVVGMTPLQRKGVIVVLSGIAISIIALAFTSAPFRNPRRPALGTVEVLLEQVRDAEIVLAEGKGQRESACSYAFRRITEEEQAKCFEGYDRDPRPVRNITLPYRYVFAVGMLVSFAGAVVVCLGGSIRSTSSRNHG